MQHQGPGRRGGFSARGMVRCSALGCDCTTKAPTCLFQAPHVLLRMTAPPGQEVGWSGVEGLGTAVLCTPVFLFPSPGPHFSLLCWPYLFTEHFSVLHPEAYSSRIFSLYSRNSRGILVGTMHPNTVR